MIFTVTKPKYSRLFVLTQHLSMSSWYNSFQVTRSSFESNSSKGFGRMQSHHPLDVYYLRPVFRQDYNNSCFPLNVHAVLQGRGWALFERLNQATAVFPPPGNCSTACFFSEESSIRELLCVYHTQPVRFTWLLKLYFSSSALKHWHLEERCETFNQFHCLQKVK